MQIAPLFRIEPLIDHIEANTLIITANSRLNNKIVEAYNLRQQEHGLKAWTPPRVIALRNWLISEFQALSKVSAEFQNKKLIEPTANQYLWQTIINSSDHEHVLINPLSLANDAASAYTHLKRWELDTDTIDQSSKTWQQFLAWSAQYEDELLERSLITEETLQTTVIEYYEKTPLAKPANVIAFGFDDIPPLTKRLLDSIADHVMYLAAAPVDSVSCKRIACQSSDDEIVTAARWAKSQMRLNPGRRVGIIVPNLGQCRDQVLRVFSQVFEPHAALPSTARYTPPFNISAGEPLASTPLISSTLKLLKLLLNQWEKESLVQLFYSPFWHSAFSDAAVQPLSAAISELNSPTVNKASLRNLLQDIAQNVHTHEETRALCEWLIASLQQSSLPQSKYRKHWRFSDWAVHLSDWLQTLGWPGNRRLDSNEYQQINQWFQLLETFSQMDDVTGPVALNDAIEWLERSASGIHFQAKTPDSPIQILGGLEASNLSFDCCWVIGMSRKQWPPSPSPNPLIPHEIQRQFKMPHADADRELHFAKQLTQGFMGAAPNVIFSWATFDGDMPTSVTPLIDQLPILPSDDLTLESHPLSDFEDLLARYNRLDWVDCTQAPKMSDAEVAALKSGAKILADQAICPMTAFMRHRLGLHRPDDEYLGLSPQDRGNAIHNILYRFWQKTEDSTSLRVMSEEQTQKFIDTLITEELSSYIQKLPPHLRSTYLDAEKQRQRKLLLRWLTLESDREDFQVVELESAYSMNLNGIDIKLRIDRVDQLPSGQTLVIDYKTAATIDLKGLWGERPDNPQLALYSLCLKTAPHAVMLGQINVKSVDLVGYRDSELPLKQATSVDTLPDDALPSDWPEVIEHWHARLSALSAEFIGGTTSLEFKAAKFVRFYEDLLPALRYQEQTSREIN